MTPAARRLGAFTALVLFMSWPAGAEPVEIPEIVVSPYFVPTSLAQSGSAITVLTREDIERSPATSVAGLLRTVPGVTVVESGGAGATAEVRLRGGETGHTLVLIDGVRVNDPATARDEFDFSLISSANIERIEVLRGPQSSIYGSDAMGGVVNIITRKASAATSFSAGVEGGSYGTFVQRLSGGMAKGDWRVLMSGEHIASAGFSRVGDRDADEADGFDRWSGTVSGVYAPAGGPQFAFGLTGVAEGADYDGAPPSGSCLSQKLAFAANALNTVDKNLLSGYGRLSWQSGAIQQSLTGFVTRSTRQNEEFNAAFGVGCAPTYSSTAYGFASTNAGGQYQATVDAGRLGQVLVGGRLEQERASYESTAGGNFDSAATRYALFAGDQISPLDHLNLSFAGRYDGAAGGDGFLTGRATASYLIADTATKLHASAGTGAKRPTSYMAAYNTGKGVADLGVERSAGIDFGIDQSLWGGRITLGATLFDTRYDNLLTYDLGSDAYFNIGRAETQGLELSASAILIPGRLSIAGAYTYLDARDLGTGLLLVRRPQHSGSATLVYTGDNGLEASITATLVGLRYNRAGQSQPLPTYGRIDVAASYPINAETRIFGRIENLTDARYEDPGGYNASGLSAYVGLTWRH